MLRAEIIGSLKNSPESSLVRMNVEGSPLHAICELNALTVAVSELLPEGSRERFIDDLPELTRTYRKALSRQLVLDNGAIKKAKENDNGDTL